MYARMCSCKGEGAGPGTCPQGGGRVQGHCPCGSLRVSLASNLGQAHWVCVSSAWFRGWSVRIIGRYRGPGRGSGSPLPRSFKLPSPEKRACGAFYGLLMAYGSLTPVSWKTGAGGFLGPFLRLLDVSIDFLGRILGFGQLPRPFRWPCLGQTDASL